MTWTKKVELTSQKQTASSLKTLLKLDDEKRVVMAAIAASGCPSGAYYAFDEKLGGFTRRQSVDFYPDKKTEFHAIVTYDGNNPYEIPIYDTAQASSPAPHIKGLLVLRPPNEPEALAEPAEFIQAKLFMAQYIAQHFEAMLTPKDPAINRDRFDDIDNKLTFLAELKKRHLATLGADSEQAHHEMGVEKAALAAVAAINKIAGGKPAIGAVQTTLIGLEASLHDIGKQQTASQLFAYGHAKSPQEKAYKHKYNGAHPLMSIITLLPYQNEAVGAGLHHMRLNRYSDKKTWILPDEVDASEVTPLAKLLRIADVTEAVTSRGGGTMEHTLDQLFKASQQTNNIGLPGIDPDMLCTLIAGGMFETYAKERAERGDLQYHPEKIKEISGAILQAYNYPAHKQEIDTKVIHMLQADPVIAQEVRCSWANRLQQAPVASARISA